MATDIKEILSEYNLSADDVEAIVKAVYGNYRSIAEVQRKDERIAELTVQIDDLNKKVEEAAEAGQQLDELQATIQQFEEKEAQREAIAKEEAARANFKQSFDAALKDRQFANDLMRETVFEKVYAMCKDNSAIGAENALESVTKDVAGVWLNPQTDPHKMPGADLTDGKQPTAEQTKVSFARAFFGSADRNN